MDDHSVDDIVDITSLSASNVKVKLFRARKKIELKLSQMLDKELHLLIG